MKYELTEDTLLHHKKVLHRIRCIKDIVGTPVKKGLIGGWIEKESNLSQEGSAWVYSNAKVWEDGYICDKARIYDTSEVFGSAIVGGVTKVKQNSFIYDFAKVLGKSFITNSHIYNASNIYGSVIEKSSIFQTAAIYNSSISNSIVQQNCTLMKCNILYSELYNCGDRIGIVTHNAFVNSNLQILQIGCISSPKGNITAYNTKNGVYIYSALFRGSIDDFSLFIKTVSNNCIGEFIFGLELIKQHFRIKE